MKILIISLPRCGSTSLLYKLSKENNLQPLFEPFDNSGRFKYSENLDNIVLKTIISQKPENLKEKDRINWLIDFTKEFDKTILLSREDFKQHCESYAYFLYYKDKGFDSVSEYKWKLTPNYNEAVDELLIMKEDLNYLSKNIGIPLTNYEHIFDVNSTERLRKFTTKIDKLI